MTTQFTPLKVGDRVKRGPSWRWYDQDVDKNTGSQEYGTVKNVFSSSSNYCSVMWDNGHENTYNIEHPDEVVLIDEITFSAGGCLINRIPGVNACPICGNDGWAGVNMFHCENPGCQNR